MELLTLFLGGGLVWIVIWVLYVLLQTILYAFLTCTTGFSGLYIGSCVDSFDVFYVGDITMTFSGLVAFGLLVATFQFGSRFFREASEAFPRIVRPFGAR